MNIKKNLIITLLLLVLIGIVYYVMISKSTPLVTVKDFRTCESAGFPIMESYPRQCRTSEGMTFVEEIILPIATTSTTSISIPPKPNYGSSSSTSTKPTGTKGVLLLIIT